MEKAKPKIRLWSKYFILICIVSLLGNTVIFMLDNTLSFYASDVWSSKSAAGLLTTTFTAGSITAAALIGNVVDRVGRRKILLVGLGCLAVGIGAMLITDAVWFNMCCRVLQGVGKGIFGVAGMSVAADIIPRDRMGEGMGYFGLGGTLAQAIGPSLGMVIIANRNYDLLFGSNFGIYVAAIIIALFLSYEKKGDYAAKLEEAEQETPVVSSGPYRGVWKLFEKGAVCSGAAAFFYGSGCTGILIFLTLYASEVLEIANPGSFFTVAAAAMLVTRLFVGKIVDRRGVLGVVTAGFIFAILCNLGVIYCGGNYILFLVCGVLYGLSMAFIYPALCAAIIIDSPKDRKGVANSTLGFLLDGGILIASALMGVVAEKLGYNVMFITAAVLNCVGVVITVLFLNNSYRAKLRKKLGVE